MIFNRLAEIPNVALLVPPMVHKKRKEKMFIQIKIKTFDIVMSTYIR